MERRFFILADLADEALSRFLLKASFELETSGGICLVEAHPPLRALAGDHHFSLAVFDGNGHDANEIGFFARPAPQSGMPILCIFIHPEGQDFLCPRPGVLHVSRALFESCYAELLAFCYITFLVRGVIADARNLE
jgi:hypothetical protein